MTVKVQRRLILLHIAPQEEPPADRSLENRARANWGLLGGGGRNSLGPLDDIWVEEQDVWGEKRSGNSTSSPLAQVGDFRGKLEKGRGTFGRTEWLLAKGSTRTVLRRHPEEGPTGPPQFYHLSSIIGCVREGTDYTQQS